MANQIECVDFLIVRIAYPLLVMRAADKTSVEYYVSIFNADHSKRIFMSHPNPFNKDLAALNEMVGNVDSQMIMSRSLKFDSANQADRYVDDILAEKPSYFKQSVLVSNQIVTELLKQSQVRVVDTNYIDEFERVSPVLNKVSQ